MYIVLVIDNTNFLTFEYLGGESESVTSYVITKTTAKSHDDNDDNIEGGKKTRATKKRKTTTRPTTIATRLARNRVTLSISQLLEDSACTFQGNMPDPDNCQCNHFNIIVYLSMFFLFFKAYYTCKEDVIARVHCPVKQLFDEDTRICNDYRKVFCADRPTNERGHDPCKNRFSIF
jgi:hypothetical protein